MPTTTNLTTLTINHVASQEVYDAMSAGGLINENELYLVPGDISIATDNTPGGTANSNSLITSGAAYAGFQTKANKENAIYFVKGTQVEATNAWTGVLTAVDSLYDGLTIAYYLPFAGTSTSATLKLTLGTNIQTADEPVYYSTTSRVTTHYGAGSVVVLTWVSNTTTGYSAVGSATGRWLRGDYANSNTIPAAYCSTKAATAAKTASHSGYALLANSYELVTITNSNTAQSALTLSINSKTAKPIYINGVASSSTNYTLPAGTYLVYYDGTNYYFRTDGKITGSITGTVNGHSVNADVPSDAVFTDTTYSFTSGATNGSIKITSNNVQDTVSVYTLPTASSSTLGGVKIGYTENGKNYPVELDNDQMYVNVPWTNVNGSYLTADDVSPASPVPTLAWGGTTTLGTVANKQFKVTMPSNPDTHYESALITAASDSAKANAAGGTNSVYLNLVENNTVRNAHQIVGSGTVTVGSNASGKITITGAGPTVVNSNPTLSWGSTHQVGTVDNQALQVTMPSNPDTHYESSLITTSTNSGKTNAVGGTNSVYLNLVENDTVRNAHQIVGSGTVSVGSDADGKITITGASASVSVPETVPTLAWGGTTTIGTVDNKQFKVKMPSDPNTHYATHLYAGTSSTSAAADRAHAATTDGNTYLKLFDDETFREKINIVGSGKASVTSDATGKITITGASTSVTDHNPTLAWSTKSKVATIDNQAINVTMPSNPNTHYETHLYAGTSNTSAAADRAHATTTDGNTYLKLFDDETVREKINIIGSGTVSVTSTAPGTTGGPGTITITGASANVSVPTDVPTLSWGGTTTIGTVDSKQFKVTMPANPNSNTTYTLTQDANDGHKITLNPSSGNGNTVTIPDENYYHTTGTWDGLTYSADNTHAPNIQLKFTIPTGTTATTVAVGNHDHDSRYYTKTEVDGKVASVLKYQGTKANVAALPSSGNTTGDVWHVTADGGEYAWNGSAWEPLGMVVDLSGYAQLSGATFTGPVIFNDTASVDELTAGNLVVTGNATFASNISANTINGVTVGNSPKFTDTVYTHPSYTSQSSGLYKITVNGTGHVSAATAVVKADITGLGIPGENTATAVDNILDGSNSGTAITYAPYSAQQSKLSFDTSSTNPTRTDRLNLNGYLYATKLYSGGAEVLTSHQSLSNYKTKQTAVSDPTASTDTSTTFIDSISQNANGEITVTKKTATDEKLKTTSLSTGTTSYLLSGPAETTAANKYYVPDITVYRNSSGPTYLTVGSASGAYAGGLVLANNGTSKGQTIINPNATSNITLTLPDATGTISLTSHVHGNITSDGDITATAPTIANGDQIIINDHSASKITNGPTFDGSTTTKGLSQKGTWEDMDKVKLTSKTDNVNYILTFGPSSITSDNIYQNYYSTSFTYNPSSKVLATGGMTLTPAITGFNISGGTSTSKTLTVGESYTLGAACAKDVTDSSSASAIGTGTSLVTERDVYYGLPSINGVHNYTSSTSIYAPADAGTSGQVLISNGSGAPSWGAAPATGTQVQIVRW